MAHSIASGKPGDRYKQLGGRPHWQPRLLPLPEHRTEVRVIGMFRTQILNLKILSLSDLTILGKSGSHLIMVHSGFQIWKSLEACGGLTRSASATAPGQLLQIRLPGYPSGLKTLLRAIFCPDHGDSFLFKEPFILIRINSIISNRAWQYWLCLGHPAGLGTVAHRMVDHAFQPALQPPPGQLLLGLCLLLASLEGQGLWCPGCLRPSADLLPAGFPDGRGRLVTKTALGQKGEDTGKRTDFLYKMKK